MWEVPVNRMRAGMPRAPRAPLPQRRRGVVGPRNDRRNYILCCIAESAACRALVCTFICFMVNVFSDPCYQVNHNYFCKHVTVVRPNCVFLDIYITSLKPLESNLRKKKKKRKYFFPNISVRKSLSNPWQSCV